MIRRLPRACKQAVETQIQRHPQEARSIRCLFGLSQHHPNPFDASNHAYPGLPFGVLKHGLQENAPFSSMIFPSWKPPVKGFYIATIDYVLITFFHGIFMLGSWFSIQNIRCKVADVMEHVIFQSRAEQVLTSSKGVWLCHGPVQTGCKRIPMHPPNTELLK